METNRNQFDPQHRRHKKCIQRVKTLHAHSWPYMRTIYKVSRNKCSLKIKCGSNWPEQRKFYKKTCWAAVLFNRIIDSDMDAIILYVFRLSSYFTCWTTSLWPTTMCTCTRGGERWSDGVWLSPPCSVSPLAFCTSSLEPREHSERFAPFQPIQTTALLANT